MDYYEEEREIDLLDLLFYVLEKWRVILIVALAACLLYGGYKYIGFDKAKKANEALVAQGQTDLVVYSNTTDDQRTDMQEKEAELAGLRETAAEYQNIITTCESTIATCESQKALYELSEQEVNRKLSELQNYMEHSLLLDIDAGSCPTATKIYQVVYDGATQTLYRDPVDEILAAYTTNVTLIGAGTDLAEKYKTEEKYLDELYKVSYDSTSNYIVVSAIGENQAMATEIRDAVCSLLESRQESLSGQFHDHTLLLVNESYLETTSVMGSSSSDTLAGTDSSEVSSSQSSTSIEESSTNSQKTIVKNTIVNSSVNNENVTVNIDEGQGKTLSETQNDIYALKNSYQSQLANLSSSISAAETNISNSQNTISAAQTQVSAAELQISIAEKDLAGLQDTIIQESAIPSLGQNLLSALKKGLIAFLIGGLLTGCYYAVVYVLDGKIHTATDLPVSPRRPLLAVLNRKKGENLNFIDEWIYEQRNKNWITPNEEILKTAAVTLDKMLDGKTRVAILSTMKENDTERITEGLKKLLPSLEFICVEDSIRSSDSAEQLTKAEAAILFETRERSKCAQVLAELSQTTLLDMPVVGFLVS